MGGQSPAAAPMAFLCLKGGGKNEAAISSVCCDRTRRNGFKLKEGRFRLTVRKKGCTIKVVRHWYRLPTELVGAVSLEVLGEAGQGSEHPDGAVDVLVHCRGVGLGCL